MKKVLIVEDDGQIRSLLSDYLKENDYEPFEAKDGREGSVRIAEQTYDIVLMDMMLPFKSGDVLIQELRESPVQERRKTPVIVLSARSVKDIRLKVLENLVVLQQHRDRLHREQGVEFSVKGRLAEVVDNELRYGFHPDVALLIGVELALIVFDQEA